jgi:hypothetical protein
MAYQAQVIRTQHFPTANTPLVTNRGLDDEPAEGTSGEKLPEDVDFSEGGWATDGACAVMALLFLFQASPTTTITSTSCICTPERFLLISLVGLPIDSVPIARLMELEWLDSMSS